MRRLLLATTFLICAAGSALAIDFNQEIKSFDDKTFIDQNGAPAPQILGTIAENTLLNPPNGTGDDEKKKRFWLALKLHEHRKDPDLTIEELALLKKSFAENPSLAIMGQGMRLIDPNFVPKN